MFWITIYRKNSAIIFLFGGVKVEIKNRVSYTFRNAMVEILMCFQIRNEFAYFAQKNAFLKQVKHQIPTKYKYLKSNVDDFQLIFFIKMKSL